MTRDEFAERYVTRSGVTVEWLRKHGREPRPCDCGEDCPGWKMANVGEERRMGYVWPEDSPWPIPGP